MRSLPRPLQTIHADSGEAGRAQLACPLAVYAFFYLGLTCAELRIAPGGDSCIILVCIFASSGAQWRGIPREDSRDEQLATSGSTLERSNNDRGQVEPSALQRCMQLRVRYELADRRSQHLQLLHVVLQPAPNLFIQLTQFCGRDLRSHGSNSE